MTGGGEAGLNDSLLQTPTYILAIVFFIFLALSFAFELAIHHLKHYLQKRGRHGMSQAVDKLVLELTLLGFVSLLLTAFSGPLGRMCVNYSDTMADWTLSSNIKGCPCCLAHTEGFTYCAQMEHGCLFNSTSRKPYCDCDVTGTSAYVEEGYEAYVEERPDAAEECLPYVTDEARFFQNMALSTVYSLAGGPARHLCVYDRWRQYTCVWPYTCST